MICSFTEQWVTISLFTDCQQLPERTHEPRWSFAMVKYNPRTALVFTFCHSASKFLIQILISCFVRIYLQYFLLSSTPVKSQVQMKLINSLKNFSKSNKSNLTGECRGPQTNMFNRFLGHIGQALQSYCGQLLDCLRCFLAEGKTLKAEIQLVAPWVII